MNPYMSAREDTNIVALQDPFTFQEGFHVLPFVTRASDSHGRCIHSIAEALFCLAYIAQCKQCNCYPKDSTTHQGRIGFSSPIV